MSATVAAPQKRLALVASILGSGIALVDSTVVNVALRALQGVFGALLTPASLAVIVNTFDEEERGPAIGAWTAWGAIATVIGPLVGGELLAVASWRWIFIINVPLSAVCVLLILRAVPPQKTRMRGDRHVDVVGALLGATGLGAAVFGLIEQPRLGWSSPAVYGSLLAGLLLFGSFIAFERRSPDPMLPLRLFRKRNFAAGNIETFSMYAGLSILFFFLTLFLQQVGGYTPLQSGLATLPSTLILFLFSRRFGALADRYGPRLFMGAGPLIAAVGLLLFQRVGVPIDYVGDVLPAVLVFAVGLAMTVAPLTAAVLADAGEGDAGIASGVNNAVARVAGLIGTAGVGAAVAASFSSRLQGSVAGKSLGAPARAAVAQARRLPLGLPSVHGVPAGQAALIHHAAEQASLHAFHVGMMIAAVLLAIGGVVGVVGIRNPRGKIPASECESGQVLGNRPRLRVHEPAPVGAK